MTLLLCTAVVFAGAALAAARLYPDRAAPEAIAERGLATALMGTTCIEAVIYALGWSGWLTRPAMAVGAVACTSAAAAVAWWTTPRAARATLVAGVWALVSAPLDLARALKRRRSAALVGYVWLWGLAVWTSFVAYLAPSGAWDGLWYHEPMVGFALQNRGFAAVELPPSLEMINGYPRATENLMLWVAGLFDRRLIDVVPSFAFLVSALATYTLARRHGATESGAVGVAVVAVTIPGAVLELRSTYVDLSVLAATLVALHFVSRPELRGQDAWMAGLALGLLGAMKANGAVFAALLGVWLLLRAILRLDVRLVAHVLGGFVFAALLAGPTYLRNWLEHDNPLWPITYESPLLGVSLHGTIDAGHMQRDFAYNWRELTGPPQIGENYHDTGRHAYGFALPFVAAPLLLVATPALVATWLRPRLEATTRRRLGLLALALAFGVLVQAASPGHHWARFSLAFPAVALVVIAWWWASRRLARLEEAALGAMTVLNALTLWWAVPGWDVTVEEALELWRLPVSERALADTSRCLLPADTRRRRDAELGPDTIAAFTDDIGFVGNLWNDHFSNRVVFVPYEGPDAFLARLDEVGAVWVYARTDSSEASALRREPRRWEQVGPGSFDDSLFARVGPAQDQHAPTPARAPESHDGEAPTPREPAEHDAE